MLISLFFGENEELYLKHTLHLMYIMWTPTCLYYCYNFDGLPEIRITILKTWANKFFFIRLFVSN